jgi:hypothetical protein
MIRLADISFIIGAGIIVIYFILTLIKPYLIKNINGSIRLILLFLPILFIVFAFIGYYIQSNAIQDNLDSIKQPINSDSLLFQNIDSLVNELRKLEQIKKEQELLQGRIRIESINQSISDSILHQIESALKNVILKSVYKNETKILITSEGKRLITSDGKILVTKEKVYNDIYSIDSVQIFPILKKIDFSKENRLHPLNYYIDSLKITFKVGKNKGKVFNSGLDSLIFVSIYPLKSNYKNYRKFIDSKNQEILYLDSVYFTDYNQKTLTIDFPNVDQNDTINDFTFYLRRGIIGSFEIPFGD